MTLKPALMGDLFSLIYSEGEATVSSDSGPTAPDHDHPLPSAPLHELPSVYLVDSKFVIQYLHHDSAGGSTFAGSRVTETTHKPYSPRSSSMDILLGAKLLQKGHTGAAWRRQSSFACLTLLQV